MLLPVELERPFAGGDEEDLLPVGPGRARARASGLEADHALLQQLRSGGAVDRHADRRGVPVDNGDVLHRRAELIGEELCERGLIALAMWRYACGSRDSAITFNGDSCVNTSI